MADDVIDMSSRRPGRDPDHAMSDWLDGNLLRIEEQVRQVAEAERLDELREAVKALKAAAKALPIP